MADLQKEISQSDRNNFLMKLSYYRRYLNVEADKNDIKIRASVRDEWSVDKIFTFLPRYRNDNTE